MPTRNILDGLRALQRHWADALKLQLLRRRIKAGREALDRGDFTDVDDAELDAHLEECRASGA
jgi:antitoxin ParD1/3/4